MKSYVSQQGSSPSSALSFFNCSPGLACLLPVTSSCFSCTCSKSHSLFWIWMQLYFSPIRKKMVWVWKRVCSVFFVVQPQVLPMVGNSSWLVASLLCFQREKVKKAPAFSNSTFVTEKRLWFFRHNWTVLLGIYASVLTVLSCRYVITTDPSKTLRVNSRAPPCTLVPPRAV